MIDQIHTFITSYIQNHTTHTQEEIRDDVDVFEAGLLDSFAALSLIISLENEFDFKFEPQELAGAEIRTIGTLSQLVHQKLSGSRSP